MKVADLRPVERRRPGHWDAVDEHAVDGERTSLPAGAGPAPSAGQLSALQRSAGNAAVTGLVRRIAAKGIEGEDEPFKQESEGEAAEKQATDKRAVQRASIDGLQRQPGPPPPPAPPPPSVAGINYLPTLKDKAPGGWGVTTEDDVVVDITAYSSGGSWKCVVSKAEQQAHQGVRLLPGVKEVTAAKVAGSNCATLNRMKKSLDEVADQKAHSGWYMLSAVQAHEDLHITQYRNKLNPAFATFKTSVEALSVPAASAADAAAARTAIKALPAYTTAKAKLNAADVAANNATAAHSPMAPFITIEHGVVDPMITTIDARRTTLKCSP